MNLHKQFQTSFSAVSPLKSNDELLKSVMERTENMEKKNKMSIKKVSVIAVAAAAIMALGITAAAESPEFNQFIYTTTGFVIDPEKVVFATPIPQKPIDGFLLIEDMGTPIAEGIIKQELATELWSVPFKETDENKYTVEKIAYSNAQTIVSENSFELAENRGVTISIDADFTAEYHTDQNGELVAVGYIYDDVAYDIFSGKTDGESLSVDFMPEKTGNYRFYIINCSAGMQNYDSVSVETMQN
ncbi:MAG: hypothetical protein IJ416_05115 [Ruminiclostridium sp.]|nr:hypothetical protein [Ruminiclostridium sp.]